MRPNKPSSPKANGGARGRKRTEVATLKPGTTSASVRRRKLGVLADTGAMRIDRKFTITDSELRKS